MENVYAVVVTHNRKGMLEICLEAILSQSVPVKGVIVLDNASSDGTETLFCDDGRFSVPTIHYVHLCENIGGAGGFHEGMKVARDMGASWIWVMDDDTVPEENCLKELLRAGNIIEGKISFLASQVRGENGEAMNVPKISRKQFFHYVDWYKYLQDGIVKIEKATFVSLLINAEAVKKCGLPWKEFFIWGDDSEYTQRIVRDYGPAYMVGKSKILHKRASAEELSLLKEENPDRINLFFYYYRNNLINFWEYDSILFRFLMLGKLGFDALMILIKGKYKIKKLKVIGMALFSFTFGTYDRKSFRNRALL